MGNMGEETTFEQLLEGSLQHLGPLNSFIM